MVDVEKIWLKRQADRIRSEIKLLEAESVSAEKLAVLQAQLERITAQLENPVPIRRPDLPVDEQTWICVRECFVLGRHWQPGDGCQSDDRPGKYFRLNRDLNREELF